MNLENILNIEYRYKIINDLKDMLKSNVSNVNNVDDFTNYFLKEFKCTNELKELDEEVLYVNLMASKTISQLAWNAYQNNALYKNCHINAQYLEKIYFVMGNRNLCENYLDKLKLGTEGLEHLLIEMLSRYIFIFCILYYKEIDNSMIKSCFYCDYEMVGDICSVCEGNSFIFKDKNSSPRTLTSSNLNPSDCLESVSDSIKSDANNGTNLSIHISDNKEKVVNDSSIELKNKSKNKDFIHGSDLTLSNNSIALSNEENQGPKYYKDINSSANISKLTADSNLAIKTEPDKEAFWACSLCSFNKNEESALSCSICFGGRSIQIESSEIDLTKDKIFIEKENVISEESSDKWLCNQCSFKNDKTEMLCSLCYANNPNENISHTIEDTWNCTKCQIKNPFDRYRCHKCAELADFFDKWVCEKCCFFNEKIARSCYACDHVNSHLTMCKICAGNFVFDQDHEFCDSCITSLERNKGNNYRDFTRNEIDEKYSKTPIANEGASYKIPEKHKYSRLQDYHWYCINEECSAINFKKAEYCDKCFVKNERKSSNSFFKVLKKDKEMKMCCHCSSVFDSRCPRCSEIKVTRV